MEEKKWSKEKEELFNRWTKYHTKENRGIVGFQQSMEDVLDFILEELDRAREEEKKNIFTGEELRYLLEIIQLDYSLATMYQQREKSDIGGKLLRELSKLTTK